MNILMTNWEDFNRWPFWLTMKQISLCIKLASQTQKRNQSWLSWGQLPGNNYQPYQMFRLVSNWTLPKIYVTHFSFLYIRWSGGFVTIFIQVFGIVWARVLFSMFLKKKTTKILNSAFSRKLSLTSHLFMSFLCINGIPHCTKNNFYLTSLAYIHKVYNSRNSRNERIYSMYNH